MNIESVLATVLSIKYPKKTLFVYNAMDNVVKVHLRRNDGKINLGELVRRAASGFKNSASGGHRNAAGGHVLSDDFESFKATFIEQYHKIK
jgi:single-stranded DNA-specific DHH superfamily exonuclease